jgi:ureidoglycolate dehydrogenase (NAD+)
VKIPISEVEALSLKILTQKYDRESSQMMTDAILFAETSGRCTHGILRLLPGVRGPLTDAPSGPPEVQTNSEISAVIDGKGNPGILVASLALRRAITIAKQRNLALVGTRGSQTTCGCLSFYLERAANAGFITVMMANTPTIVVPYNGSARRFGTNPIGFGFPTKPLPVVLDMTTAATTYGDLVHAREHNRQLPENVGVNKHGVVVTDPSLVLDGGGILPRNNSPQSTGLALIAELFAGVLCGATFCGQQRDAGSGQFFFLFSPGLLGDPGKLQADATRLVEVVSGTKGLSGEPTRVPGHRTLSTRDAVVKSGSVEVDPEVWSRLLATSTGTA